MTTPTRILLVDDDVDLRDALEQLLTEDGYAVTTASSGAEALERLGSGPPPALVLLDFMMPQMNGRQFLEQRAVRPELTSIPVLVMTAGRHLAGTDLVGAAGVIDKPFQLDALLDVVARFAADT